MGQDKYLRARGGVSKTVSIICSDCQEEIIKYQKDGVGYLHRCYLNRIISPKKYSEIHLDANITKPSGMPKLICECGKLVGIPMQYTDGRLAYR